MNEKLFLKIDPLSWKIWSGKGISHIENLYRLVSAYIELSILLWVKLLARRLSFTRASRGSANPRLGRSPTKLDRLELGCERATCVYECWIEIGSRNQSNFFIWDISFFITIFQLNGFTLSNNFSFTHSSFWVYKYTKLIFSRKRTTINFDSKKIFSQSHLF